MKITLAAALLTALIAPLPAAAITYFCDYTLSAGAVSDNGNNHYTDYDTNTSGPGAIRVTESVTTDDTLGAIGESNITGWDFTLTGENNTQTISSAMLFGTSVYAEGDFTATDSILTATGCNEFFEYFSGYNADGTQLESYQGYLYGNGSNYNFAMVYGTDQTCDTGGVNCLFKGNYGEYVNSYGANNFVGVVASPVPLPAGGLLLFSGLVGLAARRRMKRAV